jgi:glycosyltransferase involved in cell wall biosynthesis
MDNIAIAHKDYDVRGGGEILAERLAQGLDAPLVVGHGSNDHEPDDLAVTEIGAESRWHRLAERGGLPRAVAHMMLWRDHAHPILDDYDTVITSGNEPQWWTPREYQTWVAYTHSTPRWLYDRYNEIEGWPARTLTQLKRWVYQQELAGADLWVANSDIVARRMQRYWGIDDADMRVVYPPVETEALSPDIEPTGEYYLSLGRLAETKRVGEAIRVANDLGINLKVAGTGPEGDRLRALAGPTVDMLGWVEGERKRELLAGATALVSCCRNEDFGMVPVEALAAGTPVITVAEGMPQHTVSDGERGIVYERGHLRAAIQRFERDGVRWTETELSRWATEQFGVDRFVDEMRGAVAEARRRTAIDPELRDEPPTALAADGGGSDA